MWCEWLSVSLCASPVTDYQPSRMEGCLSPSPPATLDSIHGRKWIRSKKHHQCFLKLPVFLVSLVYELISQPQLQVFPLALVWYSPSAFISCSPVHILHSPWEFLCCHLLKLLLTYSTRVCLCVKYLIYPQQRSSPFVCCITFNLSLTPCFFFFSFSNLHLVAVSLLSQTAATAVFQMAPSSTL